MKPKRYYSKEFKLQASAMAEERENVTQAARELHIRPNMPRRWIREYNGNKTEAFKGRAHAAKLKDKKLSELQALKKELREVKLERDILKKAVHIFSNSDRTGLGSLSSMPIAILLRRCAKCFGLLFLAKTSYFSTSTEK